MLDGTGSLCEAPAKARHPLDLYDREVGRHLTPVTSSEAEGVGACMVCGREGQGLRRWGQKNDKLTCWGCFTLLASHPMMAKGGRIEQRMTPFTVRAIRVREGEATLWSSIVVDDPVPFDVRPMSEFSVREIVDTDYSKQTLWLMGSRSGYKLIESLSVTLSPRDVFLCGGWSPYTGMTIDRLDVGLVLELSGVPLGSKEWQTLAAAQGARERFIRGIDVQGKAAGEVERELGGFRDRFPELAPHWNRIPPEGTGELAVLKMLAREAGR